MWYNIIKGGETMLVPNQYVEMRWHPQHKAYYIDKGYAFTKVGDIFMVKAEDLPKGSHAKVRVICDYCGKEILKEYREYVKGAQSGLDCCKPCFMQKMGDMCLEKYGVRNIFELQETQDKIKETLKGKYGDFVNVAHIPEIAEKIKQTNLKKYGVPYSAQATEVKKKMRQSLYQNKSVPSSKAEKYLCNLLAEIYGEANCTPCYAYDNLNFDCLLTIGDIKIDVEMDGWYWHEPKQEHDKRRNYFLTKRGFKVLRIRFNNALPTKEQIIDAVNYLVNTNHSLKIIELDI